MGCFVSSEGLTPVQLNPDMYPDDNDLKAGGMGAGNVVAPKAAASDPSQGVPFYGSYRSADLPPTDASITPPPANSAANSVDMGKLGAKLNDSNDSDVFAALGKLYQLLLRSSQASKMAERQQRSTELHAEINQSLASADEIEKAGKDRMMAAIVQGGMSALGGMAQFKGGWDATKAGSKGVVDTQKFLDARNQQLTRERESAGSVNPLENQGRSTLSDSHSLVARVGARAHSSHGPDRGLRHGHELHDGGEVGSSTHPPGGAGQFGGRGQPASRADLSGTDGQDTTIISARLAEGDGQKAVGMAVSQFADAAGKSGSAPLEYEATVHDKEKERYTASSKLAEDAYSQSNDLVHSQSDLSSAVLDAFKQMAQLQHDATQSIVSHIA